MKQATYILVLLLLGSVIVGCKDSENKSVQLPEEDAVFLGFQSLIDAYAENTIERGNLSALAVAVYTEGNIYSNYYGELEKGKNNPPTSQSLFEIASITKTFTGALMAKAILANKISLEDDVRKYLKGDYSNLEYGGQPITIKHLLTHSLGLENKRTQGMQEFVDLVNNGEYQVDGTYYDIDDLLEDMKTEEFAHLPGTVYLYSAIGPELLAYILEQVNEQPFKLQLEQFFQELGMEHTYLQDYHLHSDHLISGYEGLERANPDINPILGGAGGAISTLPDMITYMKVLLESDEPWVKEVSKTLFESDDDDTVGYLWENIGIAKEEGFYYSKTGTSNGVQSGILLCPGSTYGLVVMANNTSDEALDDWLRLFFTRIEADLIKYPRLNLISTLKEQFKTEPQKAFTIFDKLKNDTIGYYTTARALNNLGYDFLNNDDTTKAIEIFEFAVDQYPDNANIYDSLGEAYFSSGDYQNSKMNYLKALNLNPNMDSAKKYLSEIEKIITDL